MPITVLCPKCRSRFNVSEKFAGKKGPCPKCKHVLTIPTADEQIKIHEREHEGARGASGQLLLKPIEREKVKLKPLLIVAGAVPVLAVFAVAWFLGMGARADAAKNKPPDSAFVDPTALPPPIDPNAPTPFDQSPLLIALGALALAPSLVIAAYTFLRNDELEPYRGREFLVRVLICSAVYALLWGVYWFVPFEFRDVSSDILTTTIVVIPFLLVGTGVAFATLDLEFGSAAFHYAMYFACCALCRGLLGWPLL